MRGRLEVQSMSKVFTAKNIPKVPLLLLDVVFLNKLSSERPVSHFSAGWISKAWALGRKALELT